MISGNLVAVVLILSVIAGAIGSVVADRFAEVIMGSVAMIMVCTVVVDALGYLS